jgi:hypothetical protein
MWSPTQLAADQVARGDELGRIARPPRRLAGGDLPPRHLLGGGDDLAHGEAAAVAEIEDLVLGFAGSVEGEEMGGGEIGDVDVVADRRAVRRGVIGAEDLDVGQRPLGGAQDIGDQMSTCVLCPIAALRTLGIRCVSGS